MNRHLACAIVAAFCWAGEAAAQYSNAFEETSKLLSTAARDQERTEGFFGRIALAYLANKGNTNTTSANGELDLGWLGGRWRHAGLLRATRGSSDGVKTSEEYRGNLQSDFTFANNNYIFAALDANYDRFGAYTQRASFTVGAGRRFFEGGTHELDLQAGVGSSRTRAPGEEANYEGVLNGLLRYGWKISDNAAFTERLVVEARRDNTYTESVSAVTAGLYGDLALSVSYSIRYNTQVPPDREKMDTVTAVSLIYGF